ncbi:UNVERIFIED_CONTAM: hypothetical protein P4I65_25915, partial [Escherichia coli]
EKRVFLVILFTSFSGSLVSRISGAVQGINPYPVTSILWNRKQLKIVKKNRFSRLSKEIRL